MTQIADIIRLPLTPEEAEAIAEPAVQQRIAEINGGLARGERCFIVYDGLVTGVRKALELKGWEVDVGPDLRVGSRSFFVCPVKSPA